MSASFRGRFGDRAQAIVPLLQQRSLLDVLELGRQLLIADGSIPVFNFQLLIFLLKPHMLRAAQSLPAYGVTNRYCYEKRQQESGNQHHDHSAGHMKLQDSGVTGRHNNQIVKTWFRHALRSAPASPIGQFFTLSDL